MHPCTPDQISGINRLPRLNASSRAQPKPVVKAKHLGTARAHQHIGLWAAERLTSAAPPLPSSGVPASGADGSGPRQGSTPSPGGRPHERMHPAPSWSRHRRHQKELRLHAQFAGNVPMGISPRPHSPQSRQSATAGRPLISGLERMYAPVRRQPFTCAVEPSVRSAGGAHPLHRSRWPARGPRPGPRSVQALDHCGA